ncbi:DNA polymerase III subunit gamma/tau [Brevibacillus dissolubilis]|uniref:DNA polymerase III subunit gamma/tau n=1 Tax=Brevibacillus dissolubilis TaxID=1844116 RepID=UPI0011177EBF|nr:DNA polymerase III subunit gamma/tau [Brevibacillus dissolubilis]
MAYTALYRVYRPQTFGDVIGQEHVTTTLRNALREGRLSHAYLFNGPRGTGKTSAAKIMSKAVNCEQPQDGEPCNECGTCKAITDGSVTDVLEIDAASNRGVEEIRDIRDKVKFAPSDVRYKVYIIDEVHMLTTEAFNALLKTLEEPPSHVLFILATTEPHKLPATIISRCQRFDFHRISLGEMVRRIQYICDQQQVQAEEQALKLIAKMAEGGMRDALSLLDQVISFSGKQVNTSDVLQITGAVAQTYFSTLARAVAERNVAGVIEQFEQVMVQGKDPEHFMQDFMFYYRDMLLLKTAPNLTEILERTLVDEQFAEVAKLYELPVLYETIEVLNQALTQLKWSTHSRVLVEMTLVRLCQPQGSAFGAASVSAQQVAPTAAEDVISLTNRVKQLEERLGQVLRGQVAIDTSAGGAQAAEPRREVRRPASAGHGGSKTPMNRVREIVRNADEGVTQRIRGTWSQILSEVKKMNYKYHAWMVSGMPAVASKEGVIVVFKGQVHCEKTMEPELRSMVESVLHRASSLPLQLYSITEEEWDSVKHEVQAGGSSAGGGGDPAANVPQEDPLIAEAIKLAGERFVEIKE